MWGTVGQKKKIASLEKLFDGASDVAQGEGQERRDDMSKATKTDKANVETSDKANVETGKSKGPARKSKAETAKSRWGFAAPHDFHIVGLDVGFRYGEPGFDPELYEPDRISEVPSDDFVAQCKISGVDPISVVRRYVTDTGLQEDMSEGAREVLLVAKGRQRTMAQRINYMGDPSVKVFYFVQEKTDALDVTRENEFRKVRTPLEKANHAARLVSLGYKEVEILSAFSSGDGKRITKMTLINWKRAANCCSEIQARCEAGEFPVTVCYELGKIGYSGDMSPEEKTVAQLDALQAIIDGGGTLKGERGRKNAGAVVESDTDEADEAEEGKGTRVRSAMLSKEAIRNLASVFEADEDEPFTDRVKREGKLVPSKEYRDGDFQAVASALLGAISGDDPTGKALQAFPSVYKHVKKYLRSGSNSEDE